MNSVPAAEAPRQSLGQAAYQQIYRRIMTLAYAPGQRLEEKQLMAELGIGRTPIREALLRLTAELMVESQPNRGCVVRTITLQNTRAAFGALRILEQGVAELAVREDCRAFLPDMEAANREVAAAVAAGDVLGLVEANSRFHAALARCSHNDYLIQALHKVRCETDRLAYLSFGREVDPLRSLGEHYRSVIEQHDRIAEGLASRDEAGLKSTLEAHTQAFQNRILLYMAR